MKPSKIFLTIIIASVSLSASAQIGRGQNLVNSVGTQTADTLNTVNSKKAETTDFSSLSATWTTWFDHFDKGYYGIKYEGVNNGTIYTMAVKGSWGVTKPGMWSWRIGFGKAWALNDWAAVVAPISFQNGDYVKEVKMKKNGDYDYETGLSYALLISPGLRFRLGGAVIGVSFDLGGIYTKKVQFYKSFELSLGFKI